jgi:predicted homoserine dehydrogenase-like protein
MLPVNHLINLLKEREKSGRPINVAVMGAGWFGGGLVHELNRWPGIEPRLLFSRDTKKAVDAYLQAGISKDKITVVDSASALAQAILKNQYIVSKNIDLISDLQGIDIFFDATGNLLAGARAAINVLKQKLHFITISAELDATVGYVLNEIAKENGVIFSNCDGDQPGVLARMIGEVKLMGFEIAVAGNGKGFLDYHATPEDIMPFVTEGNNAKVITSATDGSKQSFELAVLANGFGLDVDRRGMHGVKTTKEAMVKDIIDTVSKEGVIEYFMGKNTHYGTTVFVIGKRSDEIVRKDFKYLNRGEGPYYLFFRDYHLCYYETPNSIAEAVLFNTPTISPQALKADVLTVSKRDLKSGEKLDGIGGYTVYGLIDRYETIIEENLLPLGLAEYAVMTCDVKQDTPITYDMVDFSEENLIITLRNKQNNIFEANKKQLSPL